MKKLLLPIIAMLLVSCSNDDAPTNTTETPIEQEETFQDKIFNNLVFLDATYERLNSEGNQLPVSPGDAVTIFDRTTSLKITATTLETNLISPTVYFKNGSTYSLNAQVQFQLYESSRIIIKKTEYNTSYGRDRRSERYSY